MPKCGSQAILCGLPIRFDTYKGCSHFCAYCFAQRKIELNEIRFDEGEKALKDFISGKRTQETNWCDWRIPLHWGGLSDPFQPAEKKYKNSLKCLEILAETKYPFVVSTKGALVIEKEYLDLLSKCNCVVQISAVSSQYDKLEPGAPSYEERIEMIEKLSSKVLRVIMRIQPYITDVHDDVISNMERVSKVGAYGVILEGMKFAKRQPGLERVGADFVYPLDILRRHYREIRAAAHKVGLKFYCGENRLRSMGDSLTCCGIDGLDGFQANEFNLCHLINGNKATPTERQKEVGTATCYKANSQDTINTERLKNSSFSGYQLREYQRRPEYYKKMFGK